MLLDARCAPTITLIGYQCVVSVWVRVPASVLSVWVRVPASVAIATLSDNSYTCLLCLFVLFVYLVFELQYEKLWTTIKNKFARETKRWIEQLAKANTVQIWRKLRVTQNNLPR